MMYIMNTNALMLAATPMNDINKICSEFSCPMSMLIIEFAAIINAAVDIKV